MVEVKTPEDEDSSFSSDSSSYPSSEVDICIMFCWGNTANGELGLGGIEEPHVMVPRELKFNHSHSVKTSEYQ